MDGSDRSMATYAQALAATVGLEGRMISSSKTRFRELYPSHVAVFNANVCIASGQKKIWHGDLDLSHDENLLAELSQRLGETVFVLHERDGRFEHEQQPLLDKAVFSGTPTGHTKFRHAYIERTQQGRLQLRPPEPDTRRRWNWRVLRHKPGLWHFWKVERRGTGERSALVYVGSRDSGATPLLVVGLFRARRPSKLGLELTWYPTDTPSRGAPRPLIHVQPSVTIGRLSLWLTIIVWPGRTYELHAGYAVRPRW